MYAAKTDLEFSCPGAGRLFNLSSIDEYILITNCLIVFWETVGKTQTGQLHYSNKGQIFDNRIPSGLLSTQDDFLG